jgi:hypothetical protein
MNTDDIKLSAEEQKRILNKFLVDNPELEDLSSKLSTFNIFNVLKIENAEIRHSNLLAWLLDPQGSNGIGQFFIRRFISTISLENETGQVNINPAQFELMNMGDVEVFREWRNIDLLAVSEQNKFVLLIENKVKSKATKRQLQRYLDLIYGEYPKYKIIPVLLTLEEEDDWEIALDSGYIAYSHAQIYHIIDRITGQRKDRIPEDAKVFLNHYLVTLRRLTMQDDEIVSLCKAIYKKHRDAVNLIHEYGATTQFLEAAEGFISEHSEFEKLYSGGRGIFFIEKRWSKKMPACSNRWQFLSKPYPVACWFYYRTSRSKVGFIIEVGSMEDSEKRISLLKKFDKNGFKFRSKALTAEAKYTRVHTTWVPVGDADNQDLLKNGMEDILKKSKLKLDLTTEIIESFNW